MLNSHNAARPFFDQNTRLEEQPAKLMEQLLISENVEVVFFPFFKLNPSKLNSNFLTKILKRVNVIEANVGELERKNKKLLLLF